MEFNLIGTEYGGWLLNLDLVPRESTIISAGVGEDISFDTFLIDQKDCKVIGIDPTPKSHLFIENYENLHNFYLVKKALHSTSDDVIKLYKNKNRDHVSESILPSHNSVMEYDSYYTTTINLEKIFAKYHDISVIKMDIEGSEYNIIPEIRLIPESVKQVCVEFHHFCTYKTIEETKEMIQLMYFLGFENFVEKPSPKSLNELTFWR